MIMLSDFLHIVGFAISLALEIYMWLIIARVLLSWAAPDPYNPIVRALYRLTEPVLSYFRRHLPLVYGGLDFSPIAVLVAIPLVKVLLVGALYGYGVRVILGNFLLTVADMLHFALIIVLVLIIARVVVSLVNANPYNTIVRFIYEFTEPILSSLRRRLPLVYGGLDFSPLVVIIIIFLLMRLLGILTGYAVMFTSGYIG